MAKSRNIYSAKIVKVIRIHGMSWYVLGLKSLGFVARHESRSVGLHADKLKDIPRIVEASIFRDRHLSTIARTMADLGVIQMQIKTEADYKAFNHRNAQIILRGNADDPDDHAIFSNDLNKVVAVGTKGLLEFWLANYA